MSRSALEPARAGLYNGPMISAAHPRSRAFAAVLMLALLIGALVPAGFMPGRGQDGKVAVVICTGHGSAIRMIDRADLPPAAYKPSAGVADSPGMPDSQDGGDGRRAAGDASFTCPYAPVLAQQGVDAILAAPYGPVPGMMVLFAPAEAFSGGVAVKPWYGQGPPHARA